MNVLKYLFNWRYRYFVKKGKAVEKMAMDLEFKRFKTLEIREDVRREYDHKRSRKEILAQEIEKESKPGGLKETNVDEFNRLNDQMDLLNRDIERHQAQMQDLDNQVNGLPKSAENPEGVQGIKQQLDALRELKEMIRDYVRTEL